MAGIPRDSGFMPTIKCSSCGREVEISMMGEHICETAREEVPPGSPPASVDKPMTDKLPRIMPPNLEISTADKSLAGQGQLTPVSMSSGSRGQSPKTPNGRLGGSRPEDYFSPRIATDSPTSQSNRRPGGYGGLGESETYDAEPLPPTTSKSTSNVLKRMNTIAPGPFDARRPSAPAGPFASARVTDIHERPGTSGSMRTPRGHGINGNGGFGPPQKTQIDLEPKPYGLTQRSDTFPRSSEPMIDPPARTPSAPGPRPDRWQQPSEKDVQGMPMMEDRFRRPSENTPRPPHPRPAVTRSQTTGGLGGMNAPQEFQPTNSYHTATNSMSSSYSRSSQSQRSGKPSQSSLESSPPRSIRSGFDQKSSDPSTLGNETLSKSPASLNKPFASVLAKRPPRPDRGGYDPRIAPAPKMSSPGQTLSPLASPEYELAQPAFDMSSRVDPAIQEPRREQPASQLAAPPERRYDMSPERMSPRSRPQYRPRDPAVRARSRPRDLPPPVSRGNCKSCGLAITGKSISSADGRLTGRYHKACFVCTTCQSPFSSSTFYVLDDKPYCELHYHSLNGSLCGGCGNGIEGQYLEDEKSRKHHPGCFRCGDCGIVLRDGYFEVGGKVLCEKDAWARLQANQNWARKGSSPVTLGLPGSSLGPNRGLGGGMRSGSFGQQGGGGYGRLGAPPPVMPRMEKRMTRLGMM
ncbi:hypothetical protein DL546_004316 [Coniochaeta pulveracea]|uniref:LIM zinc-binding domain-containing protein n=1 Tax=Coniochaeta pulveracea TaxID=177199 RepID=A0A420Y9E2_9PEZI|nr:hypothetical protein DL546_004316 [Coniochaeta pulveracea]